MGSNLTILKRNSHQRQTILFANDSLLKIRHCYSRIKAFGQNSLLEKPRFMEIFKETEKNFALFENSEKEVDCFEFVIGLAIYSSDNFVDKCRFLFGMFNLNKVNTISPLDVEFLLTCALRFAFKTMRFGDDPVRADLRELVSRYFEDNQRVGNSDLLSFVFQSVEVSQFFIETELPVPDSKKWAGELNVIKKEKREGEEAPAFPASKSKNKQDNSVFKDLSKITRNNNWSKTGLIRERNKFVLNFYEEHLSVQERLFRITEASLRLSWIFGFRCGDVINDFEAHCPKSTNKVNFSANKKLIYFTSNVVVLFYYQTNTQKHYLGHANRVSAIALSDNKLMCASGDEGLQPEIHVWEIETRRNLIVIPFLPHLGVYLLAFTNRDKYVISLGRRSDCPMRVYDTRNGFLILSLNFDFLVLNIVSLVNLSGKIDTGEAAAFKHQQWHLAYSFAVFSEHEVALFLFNLKKEEYERFSFDLGEFPSFEGERITSSLLFYQHSRNPKLMLYGNETDFELRIYLGCESGKLLSISKLPLPQVLDFEEVHDFGEFISSVVHYQDCYFCVVSGYSTIRVFNAFLGSVVESIEMNSLAIDLKSNHIKSLKLGPPDKVFVSTKEGDLVQIGLIKKNFWFPDGRVAKTVAKRILNVEHFSSTIVSICLIEQNNADDSVVFVCTQESAIYGFLCKDHSLFYNQSIGTRVTAMSGVALPTGGFQLACGTQKGSVYLKSNIEEASSRFECGARINCVRFSDDSHHLVVGSDNGRIFIFKSVDNQLFGCPPIEVSMLTGNALSINFLLDREAVLIGTDESRYLRVDMKGGLQEVPTLQTVKTQLVKLLDSSEKLQVEQVKLQHCVDAGGPRLLVFIDADLGVVLCGESNGTISMFDAVEKLRHHAPTTYSCGFNHILDIELSKNKEKVYHFSEESQSFRETAFCLKFDRVTKIPLVKEWTPNSVMQYSSVFRSIGRNIYIEQTNKTIKDSFAYIAGLNHSFPSNIFSKVLTAEERASALRKRYPNYSLQINHVYGLDLNDIRESLFYVHFPQNKSSENSPALALNSNQIKISKKSKKRTTPSVFYKLCNSELFSQHSIDLNVIKKIQDNEKSAEDGDDDSSEECFNNQDLVVKNILNDGVKEETTQVNVTRDLFKNYITRPICADSCRRKVLYVSARFAIIVDPESPRTQSVYQGHNHRISSVAVSHERSLVATCERVGFSQIHVWNPRTLLVFSMIETLHPLGIASLQFTHDGSHLVSLSNGNANSLQFSDVEKGEKVAFRNYSGLSVSTLIVDPSEASRFYTASFNVIDCWLVENSSILHTRAWCLDSIADDYITSLFIITMSVEEKNETNFIFATASGRLGVQNQKRTLRLEQTPMSVGVTVMRLVQIDNQYFIFLAFSDSFLRIYDLLLCQQWEQRCSDKTDHDSMEDLVQSLDISLCDNTVSVLAGLSSGIVIEVFIEIWKKKSSQQWPGQLSFRMARKRVVTRSHAVKEILGNQILPVEESQRRVHFDISESLNLMVSVGDDKMLYVWDTLAHTLVAERQLIGRPTCVRISNSLEKLFVGFEHSLVLVYTIFAERVYQHEEAVHALTFRFVGLPKTLSDEKIPTAVTNILMSDSNEHIAVSYESRHSPDDSEKNAKESVPIVVFSVGESFNQLAPENTYHRKEYRFPFMNVREQSQLVTFQKSCHFMAFSDDEKHLMVYYQNISDKKKRANYDLQGKYVLWNLETGIYELDSESARTVHFKKFNFPTHVVAKDVLFRSRDLKADFLMGRSGLAVDNFLDERICLSAVDSRHPRLLFLGTDTGELLIAKSSSLDKDIPPPGSAPSECQAKRFVAHSSAVDEIKWNEDEERVFTSSFDDNCVAEWKLVSAATAFELDEKEVDLGLSDEFLYEVPDSETLKSYLTQVSLKRNQLATVLANVDFLVIPDFSLRVNQIIGRKAFNARSNVFYTRNREIIYSIGTMVIILDATLMLKKKSKQRNKSLLKKAGQDWMQPYSIFKNFQHRLDTKTPSSPVEAHKKELSMVNIPVPVDENFPIVVSEYNDSISGPISDSDSDDSNNNDDILQPVFGNSANNRMKFIVSNNDVGFEAPFEISCFELSSDFRTICICTRNLNSMLYFWDITSKSYLGQVKLEGCCSPVIIRFSSDGKYLVCCGLTKEHSMSLLFIDAHSHTLLAVNTLQFSLSFKIKDIEFLPIRNNSFVSVGINHLSKWNYQNDLLNFSSFEIEPKARETMMGLRKFSNMRKVPQESQNFFSFLVAKYIFQNICVVGCGMGFVYLFNDEKLMFKQLCFEKGAVTVITASPFIQGDFIVAGFGHKMLYFRSVIASNIFSGVTCLFEINYMETLTDRVDCQVQSLLFVEERRLVFGTRNGSLGVVELETSRMEDADNQCLAVVDADNFEPPASLKPLDLSHQLVFEFFDNEVPKAVEFSADELSIYVLTDNGLLAVYSRESLECLSRRNFKKKALDVLVREEVVLLVFQREIVTLDSENSFSEIQRYYLQTMTDIHKVRLNAEKNRFAISQHGEDDVAPSVKVFEIANDFELLFTFQTEEVEFLDFSIEQGYLLWQEVTGRKCLFSLDNDSAEAVDNERIPGLRWLTDGLLLPENLNDVGLFYDCASDIVNLVMLDMYNFVAVDQLGSVS